MINVLVIGQIPPPFGGQGIMIEKLLRLSEPDLKLHHVGMNFSEDMEEIGKVRLKKFFVLASLLVNIVLGRIRTRSRILYYPPAGPNRVPMYRDLIILLLTRWMFRKTIFHFHAGGLSELYPKLSAFTRLLFRWAYFYPDAAVRASALNPDDGSALRSKSNYVVGNGIEDGRAGLAPIERSSGPPRILYVGKLCETKGVLVLLEACRLLLDRNLSLHLDIVGGFESRGFQEKVMAFIANKELGAVTSLQGVLIGEAKFRAYGRADIFCFPTYFDAETFGLVSLEAMCMGLPVVATRWRGIPSVVRENESAFLVPVMDATALAEKLEILLLDPELRNRMGKRGREIFEKEFTLDIFHRKFAEIFRNMHG